MDLVITKDEEKKTSEEDGNKQSPIKLSKTKTCEVCGHLNDENALMCEMCSNYFY